MHGEASPEGVSEQHASLALAADPVETSAQARGPDLEPTGGRRIDVLGHDAHGISGPAASGQPGREIGPHGGRLEGPVQAVQIDHANFLGRGW